MTLDRIIQDSKVICTAGNMSKDVLSVCTDSRKVTPGALFVAVRGFAGNGHDYICDSI